MFFGMCDMMFVSIKYTFDRYRVWSNLQTVNRSMLKGVRAICEHIYRFENVWFSCAIRSGNDLKWSAIMEGWCMILIRRNTQRVEHIYIMLSIAIWLPITFCGVHARSSCGSASFLSIVSGRSRKGTSPIGSTVASLASSISANVSTYPVIPESCVCICCFFCGENERRHSCAIWSICSCVSCIFLYTYG